MAGPWEKFQAAPATPSAPVALTGPKAPAPQTPAQAQGDVLQNQRIQQQMGLDAATADAVKAKAEADALRAQAELAKAQQDAKASDGKATALDAFAQQLDRVDELYRSGFKDQGLSTFLELFPTPKSQQFNAASAGLGSQGMAAFKVEGAGTQSDADLRAFLTANQPSNLDSDLAIEEKLNNVRRRIDAARQAQGLPAWQWKTGESDQPSGAPVVTNGAGQPPAGPPGPVDPGARTISPDGSTNAPSEAGKAFAQIASDAFQKGASRGELDALAAQYGFPPFGPQLDRALSLRDKGYKGPVYFTPPPGESKGPSVLGSLAATGPGAMAGQFANVLTSGGLDELARITGGDPDQAQWAKEAMREAHPGWSFAGDLAGAAALGYGAGRIPALAARPLATGVGTAAAYGAGEYNNNRLMGALGSGALALGIGAGGNALLSRVGRGTPGGPAAVNLAQAADQEGIRVTRPLLDPSTRDRMAFLEASPGTGAPIRQGLQNTTDDIEAGVARLARGGTGRGDDGLMGEVVQDAGRRFIDRSRGVGQRLYDRAAQMAGNNRITPTEAVRVLDENIADLSQNPNANGPLIDYLNGIRADLVDNAGNIIPKSVAAIRDLRTTLRGQISSRNLTQTDAERRMGQVLDAARTDIGRDLAQSAPSAARAYQRADRFWAERASEIKQVVEKVIGPRDNPLSGQKVMDRMRALANKDPRSLQRVVDKMSPDERADYAATIAESLGRRAPGEDFSPALLVSQLRTLSPAARRTIFGRDGAQSIANLRSLAEAQRDTIARLNNSRSGVVQNWGAFLRQFMGGGTLGTLAGIATGTGAVASGGTGIALGAASAGLGLAARRLSARSLMNPNLSRWLAGAARANNPSAIRQYIDRLPGIASRDPAIAQDVTALYRALSEAVNDNTVARAVASPEEGQANDQR